MYLDGGPPPLSRGSIGTSAGGKRSAFAPPRGRPSFGRPGSQGSFGRPPAF
jgi:hypothetical protein